MGDQKPAPARPESRPLSGRAEPQRRRPDPNPMRLALGVGGLATLSAIATAIAAPAASVAPVVSVQTTEAPAAIRTAQRPVVYVQLAPGETPPPGAAVIKPDAPKPITIVTTVTAPPQRSVVVRTTQSGKVIP